MAIKGQARMIRQPGGPLTSALESLIDTLNRDDATQPITRAGILAAARTLSTTAQEIQDDRKGSRALSKIAVALVRKSNQTPTRAALARMSIRILTAGRLAGLLD